MKKIEPSSPSYTSIEPEETDELLGSHARVSSSIVRGAVSTACSGRAMRVPEDPFVWFYDHLLKDRRPRPNRF